MTPKRKLSDIINGNSDYFNDWQSVKPAEDFTALPKGEYEALILKGSLSESRANATPSFKLEFCVVAGEFTGRKFWHDIYLTDAAKRLAKRDFDVLGITDPATQLKAPFPRGLVCKCLVVLHQNDDGTTNNKVRHFEVIRIDEPQPDAFAPGDETELPA